jgi:anti-sigma factor RsiW
MIDSRTHLQQGDLLRFLDGEGEPAERARWSEHLASCQECALARSELQSLLGGLSIELEPLAPSPEVLERARPPAHHGGAGLARASRAALPRWFRIAAGISVLALPLAALEPVRSWVVERAHDVGGRAASGAMPAVELPADSGPSRIRFLPAGPEMSVEISSRQAAGTLVVRQGDATAGGVLEIVGATRGEATLISERAVRIETTGSSTASYHLDLPPSVRLVRVRIGGGSEIGLDPAALAASATFDLR